MKKLIRLMVVTLLALLVGCASHTSHPATSKDAVEQCQTGDPETDLECLRAQNTVLAKQNQRLKDKRLRQLDSESGDAQAPSDKPHQKAAKSEPQGAGEGGTRVVERRVMDPIGGNPRNGCNPGFNFAVNNDTALACEATSSIAMHLCGKGGVIQRWVKLPNGQTRLADLAQSGTSGYYYFDPLLGGNGPQSVVVRCYNTSSLDGFSPETPLVAVGHAHTYPVYQPAGDPWGSHVDVVPSEVLQ